MKKKKINILAFLAIVVVLLGAWAGLRIYFSGDPPIENVTVNNPDDYGKVNRYVKRLIKTDYAHILPEKIPVNCRAEYDYSYQCDFDGRLYLTIYLELCFDEEEDYLAEVERIEKNSPSADLKYSQERQYYIYNLSQIENYFNGGGKAYSGYSAAFTAADDSENSIRYLIIKQYSNENKLSDSVNEMLDSLDELRTE